MKTLKITTIRNVFGERILVEIKFKDRTKKRICKNSIEIDNFLEEEFYR